MMFTRADIRSVIIAVTEKDYSPLVVKLGRSGLVHVDRVFALEEGTGPGGNQRAPFSTVAAAAARIFSAADDFFTEAYSSNRNTADADKIPDDVLSSLAGDTDADAGEAERIMKKIRQYAAVRARILDELNSLELKLGELKQLGREGIDFARLRPGKYFSYIYGRVSGMKWLNYIDRRIFCIISGENILCIFPPDLKQELMAELAREGFEDHDSLIRSGFTLDDETSASEKRVTELQSRLARLDSFYIKKLPQWKERMQYLADVYAVLIEISGAESKFIFSDELIVISGWINAGDAGRISSLLAGICGERFYLKTGSRRESRRFGERVPVLLKNNILFRPFELLVKMMGIPGNSEVDPTPAAALAYVIIFGVMFGDAGQGLVLALTGFVLNMYGKRRYRSRNNISDFGSIMTWCGFSAAVFGLLYGSIFSNEHLIPAVLFHPMENMMQLLLVAVMMGTVFISTGLLLNIINGLISGRYGGALFGAKGLPGLAIYGSFIYMGFRFILTDEVPSAAGITAALALPAAVFCARGPLEYILFRGEHPFGHGLFEYIVETLVDIIEMFSGFLGNTISYIRAGAFALSHAGLSLAVYTLAGIVDPSIMSVPALSVIVIGNIFIILLEGLVCGIQSMRLEYYEFFSKFFTGDGTAFSPFTLGLRQVKYGGSK